MVIVSYKDFKKIDLRVAKVLEAEKIEGTDKLLKLKIDAGEKRQIVAGISQCYKPENLLGKNIIIVANLEPAVIRGVRSEGMLLAAGNEKNLSLLTTDKDVVPGSKVS